MKVWMCFVHRTFIVWFYCCKIVIRHFWILWKLLESYVCRCVNPSKTCLITEYLENFAKFLLIRKFENKRHWKFTTITIVEKQTNDAIYIEWSTISETIAIWLKIYIYVYAVHPYKTLRFAWESEILFGGKLLCVLFIIVAGMLAAIKDHICMQVVCIL